MEELHLTDEITPDEPVQVAMSLPFPAPDSLWLEADTLALADNDPIILWQDASGAGLDFSADPSAAPTFIASSQGGHPTVFFNGVDRFLSCPGQMQAAHVFAVMQWRKGKSGQGGLLTETADQPSGPDGWFFLDKYIASSQQARWKLDGSYFIGREIQVSKNGVPSILFGADQWWLVDGFDASPEMSRPGLQIGLNKNLGHYWYGEVSAILAYSTVQTGQNLIDIREYLRTKYVLY